MSIKNFFVPLPPSEDSGLRRGATHERRQRARQSALVAGLFGGWPTFMNAVRFFDTIGIKITADLS